MTVGTAYGRKMDSRANRWNRTRLASRSRANSSANPIISGTRMALYSSTRSSADKNAWSVSALA